MSDPYLVELYQELPEARPGDDPEDWSVRMRVAYRAFRDRVLKAYTEGTLQRLLGHHDMIARRAAVVAVGLIGTMASNHTVAARLHDEDLVVRDLATDTLWELWFRGGTPEQNQELQRILRLRDADRMLPALDALIRSAPGFAEAVNQRAIVHFRRGEFRRSISDCRRVMRMNPHHYGAQSGMGQCYLRLNNGRAALDALELALRIHPSLDGIQATIEVIRESLGDE